MAFESLSERLQNAIKMFRGTTKITEEDLKAPLREVRMALLEADVNYRIVKEFLDSVRQKALGQNVLTSVEPGEMLVKIVHDEIVDLLGHEDAGLKFKEKGITVIMMVGLQGTGKTTSTAKIASILQRKYSRRCLLSAADVVRPAAIEQLQTLGKEINAEVFT